MENCETQLLQISQEVETAVEARSGKAFAWRYAYTRSADTIAANDTGQDYLAFEQTDTRFLFALCDGVSQSFYGDIAARYLGDALLEWLKGLPDKLDLETLTETFGEYLRVLTGRGSELVNQHQLPAGLAPMINEVLEQKRLSGSDTTFVCGLIELPTKAKPEGQMLLAWMGDSRLRFWGPKDERTSELGETFTVAQRWSSRRGAVGGSPNIFLAPLVVAGKRQLAGLAAYSDGLATLDAYPQLPSNQQLQDLISASGASPNSDDISFLEIRLDGAAKFTKPVQANQANKPEEKPKTIESNNPEGNKVKEENAGSAETEGERGGNLKRLLPRILLYLSIIVAMIGMILIITGIYLLFK